MAGPKPDDVYNPVPTATPQTGMPSDYLTVQSNPNQFGAQVGQAIQKLGATGEQVSTQLADTGIQYQGMLNESAATDLATKAQIERDNINAKYKTSEGFDAVNGRENAIAAIAAVRQNTLALIKNPAVARAYNLLDHRQEAFSINEANSWGITQGHTAAKNSAESSIDLSVDQMGSPDVANNDNRITDNVANVKFKVAQFMQLQGYGQYMSQDPKTGTVAFDNSPQGQQAQAVYQHTLNEKLSKGYSSILQIKAVDNPIAANQWLEDHKNEIPRQAYTEWSYKLKGAVQAADTATFANGILAQTQAHYEQNLNPSTGPITVAPSWLHAATQTQESQNNLNAVGPYVPGQGSAQGAMQVMPNTLTNPGFGVTPAKDRSPAELKRVGDDYLDAMYKKYNGDPLKALVAFNWGPGHADAWIKQGADFSQLPPETQVYLGQILPKGMGATGGSLNQVDFIRLHEPEILNNTFNQAMQKYGDITLANQAMAHVEQHLNLIKQQADDQIKVQRDQILQVVKGDDQHPPIMSMSQLEGPGADPKLAAQWLDYKSKDWMGSSAIENLIVSRNKGVAKTYGTDFYNQLQGTLTGKIKDPNSLGPYMKLSGGSPEDANVTNTGYWYLKNQISQLQDPKNGPANAAFAQAESQALKTLHDQATGSNIHPNLQSPELENAFNKNLINITNRIDAEKAAGKTAAQLFHSDSPDYIGKYVQLPKPETINAGYVKQIMAKEGLAQDPNTKKLFTGLNSPTLTADEKRQSLIAAHDAGLLTPQQADDIADQYGLINRKPVSAPPSVPFPH